MKSLPTHHNLAAALALSLAAFSLAAPASAQTFSVVDVADDGSNITAPGSGESQVFAWYVNGGTGTQAVNGVTFTRGSSSHTDGGATATISNSGGRFSVATGTATDAGLLEILAEYQLAANAEKLNLEITGLTNGQEYRLQTLHQHAAAATTRGMKVDYLGTNAFGGTIIGSSSSFTIDNTDPAKLVTVTWTADGTTQRFELAPVFGGDQGRGYFNAASLQAIPEPGTYSALLGLGALLCVALRRRLG